MNNQRIDESPMRMNGPRREVMKEPEEVAAMLRLWAVGIGCESGSGAIAATPTWFAKS